MTTTLTDTQRAIIETAAAHQDGLAAPPAHLALGRCGGPAWLEAAGAVGADQHGLAWTVDGAAVLLRLADDGLRVVCPADGGAPSSVPEPDYGHCAHAARSSSRAALPCA